MMNKITFLIVSFLLLSGYVSGADLADSVLIDKKKAKKLIKIIKKKQEYSLFDESLSLKDASFSYPEKVAGGEKFFEIEIRWKNRLIYIYSISIPDYKIKMIADLR